MYPELHKFKEISKVKNVKVANFGTGMGYYDFVYNDIKTSAFNFALTQQSLQFDYKILKNYWHKLDKGCKVILVLPYFIFSANTRPKGSEHLDERYYSILPRESLKGLCGISYEAYVKKVQDEIFKKEEDLELINPLTKEQMEIESQEALACWKSQLQIISFSEGEVSEYIKEEMKQTKMWIKKILEFCKEKQYEPIVVVPPMSKILLEKISYAFRKTHFYDILNDVLDETILVLDYSEDEKFCNPELYGWPGFLVKDAAKEFTRDVLSRIGLC